MRNSEMLTPEQQAFVGYFSTQKAEAAYNTMRRFITELGEMSKALWDLMQKIEESGIDPSGLAEEIQFHEDCIELTKIKIVECRREFEEACEEAGEYMAISSDVIKKLAMVAAYEDNFLAPPCC